MFRRSRTTFASGKEVSDASDSGAACELLSKPRRCLRELRCGNSSKDNLVSIARLSRHVCKPDGMAKGAKTLCEMEDGSIRPKICGRRPRRIADLKNVR